MTKSIGVQCTEAQSESVFFCQLFHLLWSGVSQTLMAVLDTTLDIHTDAEKILGTVEATLTDLLPEPDIEQRLGEIRENLIKNTDESIIIAVVFLWQQSL